MKKIFLILFVTLVSCSSPKDFNLKAISVKEFKDFIDDTGYITVSYTHLTLQTTTYV